jgi:hypothetical protein
LNRGPRHEHDRGVENHHEKAPQSSASAHSGADRERFVSGSPPCLRYLVVGLAPSVRALGH